MIFSSDGFELKFLELSQAELKGSRAELEHFNFRAKTELTKILELQSNSNFDYNKFYDESYEFI